MENFKIGGKTRIYGGRTRICGVLTRIYGSKTVAGNVHSRPRFKSEPSSANFNWKNGLSVL